MLIGYMNITPNQVLSVFANFSPLTVVTCMPELVLRLV